MTRWRRQIQCLIDDPSRPILPWLAPRVFRPWPEFVGSRKASTETRRDVDTGQEGSVADGNPPSPFHRRRQRSTDRTVEGPAVRRTTRAIKDKTKLSVTTYTWRGKRREDDIQHVPKIFKVYGNGRGVGTGSTTAGQKSNSPGDANTHGRNRADEWYEAILGLDQQDTELQARDEVARGSAEDEPMKSRETSKPRQRRKFRRNKFIRIDRPESRRQRVHLTFIRGRKTSNRAEASKRLVARKATRRRSRYLRDVAVDEHTLTVSLGRRWFRRDLTVPTARTSNYEYLFGDFSTKWLQWMARLKKPYFTGPHHQPLREPGALDPAAPRWARSVIDGKKRAKHIQAEIKSLPERRHRVWEEALLWILQHSPDETFAFLRRSHVRPLPPQYMVGQALEYLILRATSEPHLENQDLKLEIGKNIAHVSKRPEYDQLYINGAYLAWLMKSCDIPTLLQILKSFDNVKYNIPLNTRLHVIQKLASSETTLEAALDQLGKIGETPSFNHDLVRKACFKILSQARKRADGHQLCIEAITHVLRSGANLNVQLCTMVILNSVRAGDVNAAFKVYNMLLENKIEPDKFVFAALARACKLVPEDGQRLASVIETALQKGMLLSSRVVASEVLDALYQHHKKADRQDTFQLMLESYAQLFDTSPLRTLELIPEHASASSSWILPPEAPPLGIIIQAWLSHGHPHLRGVLQRYRVIRHLALTGHEPFVKLLQSDHMSNAFIAWFAAHRAGLKWVMEVVRNMEHDAREVIEPTLPGFGAVVPSEPDGLSDSIMGTAGADIDTQPPTITQTAGDDETSGRPMGFSPPTRTTISILHRVLCQHAGPENEHIRHAERVLEQMLSNKHGLDKRHWLSMLYAYKRVHDFDSALWCVDKMEEQGCWRQDRGANVRMQLERLRNDTHNRRSATMKHDDESFAMEVERSLAAVG
ncbi:Hypothetical protein D9617_12g036970 [Elsinoe fawcettii]|nr:Hypothetical protein D9617_12g036970 [Elsinoe fawcettii]